MTYSIEELLSLYSKYKNPYQKISTEIKNNRLFKIKRSLYIDNSSEDLFVIANELITASYISFESALAFYNLIPEKVANVTSASLNIRKRKTYCFNSINYLYYDIPQRAYCEGFEIVFLDEKTPVRIATKEKAICDRLYMVKGVRSIKEIKSILFENLRIDEEMFNELDFDMLYHLADLYQNSITLKTFKKFVGGLKHE